MRWATTAPSHNHHEASSPNLRIDLLSGHFALLFINNIFFFSISTRLLANEVQLSVPDSLRDLVDSVLVSRHRQPRLGDTIHVWCNWSDHFHYKSFNNRKARTCLFRIY
jgi:hypothetical protein